MAGARLPSGAARSDAGTGVGDCVSRARRHACIDAVRGDQSHERRAGGMAGTGDRAPETWRRHGSGRCARHSAAAPRAGPRICSTRRPHRARRRRAGLVRRVGRRCVHCAGDGWEFRGRTRPPPPVPSRKGRARVCVVAADGRQLLGSPLDVAAIAATAGCVSRSDGGLTGWAWHPGDPGVDPVLTISRARGRGQIRIAATDTGVRIDDSGLLARPRGFTVPADALKGLTGLLHVRGRDGKDLFGSPLDPRAELAVPVVPHVADDIAPAAPGRRRGGCAWRDGPHARLPR